MVTGRRKREDFSEDVLEVSGRVNDGGKTQARGMGGVRRSSKVTRELV